MENELLRVFCGGSWDLPPSYARVADPFQFAPGSRYNDLGVRIIRIINPLQQLAEVENGQ